MIIRTNENLPQGLVAAEFKKDLIVAHYMERITPILMDNFNARMFGGNGATDGKEFQHIARIPRTMMAELQKKYPGILSDQKVLYKFLKSDEGEEFLRVKKGELT